MSETQLPQVATYSKAWRARVQDAQRLAGDWRRAVRTILPEAVALLRRQFGASRVILFGSFARDEAAPGSDLDLLAEGLDPARLLEATIAVQDLLDERLGTALGGAGLPTLDLDLVPRQLVRAPILARIETEGVILDEHE